MACGFGVFFLRRFIYQSNFHIAKLYLIVTDDELGNYMEPGVRGEVFCKKILHLHAVYKEIYTISRL